MRLLFLLITLCAISSVFANASTTPFQAASLKANFVQTHYLPALTRPLITKGVLHINKKGFSWQVNSPYQYTYRMHNGTMTEIDATGNKKSITAEQAPWIIPINNLFTALLSNNTTKLEQLFVIADQKTENGMLLTMTPRSQALQQAITQIKVWHSPWPERIVIDEAGGGRLEIELEITQVTRNETASENNNTPQ